LISRTQINYTPLVALDNHVQDNFATVNEVGSAEHVVKNYYENPVYTHMAAIPSFFQWIPRPLGAPVLRFFMAKGLAAQNTTRIERVQCELKKLSDVLKDEDVGPTIDLLKVTWQSPLFICTVRTCSQSDQLTMTVCVRACVRASE
jgi:hypothetical protein